MTLTPDQRQRVHTVGANLCGTAGSLEQHATKEERENIAWLQALDEEVMECVGCGWWVEPETMDESRGGEMMCIDCRDDGN